MKIKGNYVLRRVADTIVVVPVGKDAVDFNGMITLNGSAEILWNRLENDADVDDLAALLVERYGISNEKAINDVKDFLESLREADLLD